MKSQTDLVALGETLIDFTPAGQPNTFTANPGGAPANVLVMAAKAGCRVAFIGKVGEDQFGNLLMETLRDNGSFISVWDGKVACTSASHDFASVRSNPVYASIRFISGASGEVWKRSRKSFWMASSMVVRAAFMVRLFA